MAKPVSATVSPRATHKVPAQIVKDLGSAIRQRFYPGGPGSRGETRFFEDLRYIDLAITEPARFLKQRMGDAAPLRWDQYEAIIYGIMDTVAREGNLAIVRCFGVYFLKCVQTHMPKHWEDYREQAMAAVNFYDSVLLAMKPTERPAVDNTVADLAALNASIKPASGRKKKVDAGDSKSQISLIQQELF